MIGLPGTRIRPSILLSPPPTTRSKSGDGRREAHLSSKASCIWQRQIASSAGRVQMELNASNESLFGWDGVSIEIGLSNPDFACYMEEAIGGVEVSLVDDGGSIFPIQTRADVDCTKGNLAFDGADSVCTRRVNNISASSESGSESSGATSESSFSQRSYLQLAIPAAWQSFDAGGFECYCEQLQDCENNDIMSSHEDLQSIKSDRTSTSQSSHQRRDTYRYEDSQEMVYEPKPRSICLGARRTRASMHSRIEWWNHQLSKPIRALTGGGRRSFLRSPLSDCLGRKTIHAISPQPQRSNDDNRVGHSGWADFSSQSSIETEVERDYRTVETEIRRDQPNWFAHPSSNKDGMSFEVKETQPVRDRSMLQPNPPSPPEERNSYGSTDLSCTSDLSPAAGRCDPWHSACAADFPISKQIVVIDFDARTLVTHQGTEEDSSDDESAVHIEWDLG
jgi:hypothetical protein